MGFNLNYIVYATLQKTKFDIIRNHESPQTILCQIIIKIITHFFILLIWSSYFDAIKQAGEYFPVNNTSTDVFFGRLLEGVISSLYYFRIFI